MIINISNSKSLEFEVQIQGIDYTSLTGYLRILINNVEYGFPVEIKQDSINAEIPPLNTIIPMTLENGMVVQLKLEIFGNGFYLNPWNGEAKLEIPIQIEVKMKEDFNNNETLIKAELKEDKDIEKSKPVINEKHSDEEIQQKSTKNEKPIMLPKGEKRIVHEEEIVSEEKDDKDLLHEMIKNKITQKLNKMKDIVHQNEPKKIIRKDIQLDKVVKKKPIPKSKPVNETKKETKPIIKKENITENDLYTFMSSVGMKNRRIQESMIEKVKELADDPPAMYEVLQKMLRVKTS